MLEKIKHSPAAIDTFLLQSPLAFTIKTRPIRNGYQADKMQPKRLFSGTKHWRLRMNKRIYLNLDVIHHEHNTAIVYSVEKTTLGMNFVSVS